MNQIKTKVGIIGAGPSGLTLALSLHKNGIESVIIENRSREYIENRVRAGLLEHNTVEVFDSLNVSDRLHQEGLVHHGCYINYNGVSQRIDFQKHTQKEVTIYGQQEVVKDLVKACLERNISIIFEAEATKITDLETSNPNIYFTQNGEENVLTCDFVGGCDGFHGLARKTLPKDSYKEYKIEYPFSWLGILAYAKPAYDELIYAYHSNGFALASLRSEKIVRLYLQVSNDDSIDNWSDEMIWDELENRLEMKLNRGEIFEKGITPMRSFMIDNMQFGRLFLAGDSAHIVPPTGAKGLNLAVADIHNLANGLVDFYQSGSEEGLNNYTKKCLARVWRVQDFSNFMTYLCHKQTEEGSFESLLQKSKFDYLTISEAYQKTIAENYVGLPFEVFG
ncbi:p-hydroxybenzoate 3-monooxygenase [Arcicella aurantiaca]|uniref:p-hydroxybenzoate 3-monooxygenase n=1 Tax=Arcicella aurantiaca TaxID=591202 RepID=A0A316DM42_9BACT|nr:4-hydroxybenzoate 3-monooxygenase [Arcicella aurantiaca]PWK18776.1 p-hydroxybenzoate 3-monooxygenase [Arcicella aurantiaca]